MQQFIFHPFHFNRSCHFFRVCPDYFFSSRFLMPYKIGFIKHTTIRDTAFMEQYQTFNKGQSNSRSQMRICIYSIHLIKSVENATNGIMRDTDSGITDKDEKSIINTFAHYKIVLIFWSKTIFSTSCFQQYFSIVGRIFKCIIQQIHHYFLNNISIRINRHR